MGSDAVALLLNELRAKLGAAAASTAAIEGIAAGFETCRSGGGAVTSLSHFLRMLVRNTKNKLLDIYKKINK